MHPKDSEAARKAEQKAEELRALGREAGRDHRCAPLQRRAIATRLARCISHPDYGRGKVETVLRSSLLVRFPIGGLKSLMLS